MPALPVAIRPWMTWLALVLILCLLVWIQRGQLNAARDARAIAELQMQAQTAALLQLQTESNHTQQRAGQAQRRAATIRTQTEQHVQAALTAPVPTDCIGAMRWGADAGAALALRWESAP